MNEVEQLKETIEQYYGFKRELIQDPEQCGLWHVRFTVNGIRYYGSIAFFGALPTLKVEGYATQYFDNFDTPVTEDYYNQYIRGREIRILHTSDLDSGDWEDTGVRCQTQETAKKYIRQQKDPNRYMYDFLD